MSDDLERKSYAELRRILENRSQEFRWSFMEGVYPVLKVRSLEGGNRWTRFTGSDSREILRQAIRYLAPRR